MFDWLTQRLPGRKGSDDSQLETQKSRDEHDHYKIQNTQDEESQLGTETKEDTIQSRNWREEIHAWVVITAATAVMFVGVGYTNAFGVFQEYYQTVLFPDQPEVKLLLIGSIAASLYMTLGALAGRFADIVGYQVSLAIGSALMIGSMFAASVCKEFYQFFLSQGLMFGIGLAFAYAPAVSVSRQYFGPERHGMANGIVVSGGALGGCVLPYSMRSGIEQHGLSAMFRILGYLAAGILVPSTILLKPKIEPKPPGTPRGPLVDYKLLNYPPFLAVTVGCFIAMIGFLPRYFLLTPSAVHQGIGGTYASWVLGLMNGLSIIGRVGIGLYSDRYGQVNALQTSFICCGIGHLIFWVPALAVPGNGDGRVIALFTLFAVYIGLFGSGFLSLFAVVIAHICGAENLASKVGMLNTFVGLGAFIGPEMMQAIVSYGAGHWITGITVSGCFMIAGGLIIVFWFMALGKSPKELKEEEVDGKDSQDDTKDEHKEDNKDEKDSDDNKDDSRDEKDSDDNKDDHKDEKESEHGSL